MPGDRGYIAVSRAIWEHPLFPDEPMSKREAWLWMLNEAAWRPCTVKTPNGPVSLDRGQFSHSIRYLANKFGWSTNKVQRFLRRIENEHMIGRGTNTATNTAQLIVTICNYDKYQTSNATVDTAANTPADTPTSTPTNTKKKNITNNQSPSLRSGDSARGSRLPEDWQPDEVFARKEGLGPNDVQREADKFRDHWRAQPGQKGVKSNWQATWKNWVRRAVEDRRARAERYPTRQMPDKRI